MRRVGFEILYAEYMMYEITKNPGVFDSNDFSVALGTFYYEINWEGV